MRLRPGAIGAHLVLIILAVISLYPLYFVAQTVFKTNADFVLNPTGLPQHPTLSNFSALFAQMPFWQWTGNSAQVVVVSVTASTLISLLTAYAIAFGSFRGRALLFNINVALMALPPVALVVPLFTVMVSANLINTLPSVMIIYAGLMIPFSVFFLVNFFRELPTELIEAATVDGASHLRILARIVMPLSLITTFTLVVVNAIWVWNELLYALVFLQSNSARTVMAGIALSQGRFATNIPLVMTGALLSMAPLIVLYLAGQRFFVRGLTAGIGK
jgi:ABC-type glycerol-3-phosphate transport system permease component